MNADYVTHKEFEHKFSNLEARLDTRFQHLENKIDNVEVRLQTSIKVIETRLESFQQLFKSEMENLHRHFATKAELGEVETRMTKWLIAAFFTSIGLAATITFGLAKLLG